MELKFYVVRNDQRKYGREEGLTLVGRLEDDEIMLCGNFIFSFC